MFNKALVLIPALALAGCDSDPAAPAARIVALTFQANVSAEVAACGTTYTGLGTSDAEAQLADARFYVSGIEARNAAGAWTAMTLEDSDWQRNGVALLDFEDGTAACADSGTAETNAMVTGTLPSGDYDAIRFRVGIPFELNHLDNATAPAPFNAPGMFWAWQGGYKFVRVDWAVTGGAVARWNVHLGSTGCVSAAPTEAPTAPCGRGNAPTIEVTGVDLDADVISFDLKSLVAQADLAVNTESTPPGCMSSPGEPDDCGPVFSALGLSFGDGACVDGCVGQTTFAMVK